MILSREELIELTQRQRSRAQATVLRHLGIDFRTRPDGSLAVSRAAVEAALGGPAESRSRRATAPNWGAMINAAPSQT